MTLHRRRPPRLDAEAYEEGAVHLILSTKDREPLFRNRELARVVFDPWRRHPLTLAACLMSNHLHWLVLPHPLVREQAARLKSWTTRLSWRMGHSGALWQRGIFDRVARRKDDVFAMAVYIVDNPVEAGLVATRSEYPFQVLYEDRFGM